MARLLGERKSLFAANLVLRLIKDLLPFIGPILVGITVDLLSGSSGRDRSLFGIELTQNDVRSIVIVAVIMAVLAVTKTIIGYIHTIVAAHVGRHVVQAARRDLADAAMQMSLDERRRFNSGDLLDRCLADSKGLRGFTQNVIIRVISNTVRAVFPVVFMFAIDPLLAVVVLAVIPLQSTMSGLLQRRLQRQTHEARARESAHTSAVKEAIDGWNNVASVGGQEWAAQGIHATAAASEDAKIVKKHTTASISAVISLCTAFGIAAVYAIGGWRIITSGVLDGTGDVAAGALTLGSLTAFIGVAKKTYAPFRAYTKIVSSYRTGLVNLERIADVLDAPMSDPRHDGPELRVEAGTITLDDVSFAYSDGDSPTLRALTGSIPGKSLTVITGSSGAGKTTLLRLLLGLDVPSQGTVSIDGQDINIAKGSSVQAAIALVPQEPVLFTGTMSENLLLGLEDVSTKGLLQACDQAGLVEMVRNLPNGLDTEVGSGKHMLSGGQLRRMAIARALLRQPAILLLDEPTTGLDIQNSMLVLNTLRRISSHTTVVMVSHRSEPLKASDHHLILQDGGWHSSVDHHGASAANGAVAPLAASTATAAPNANGNGQTSAAAHTHAAQDSLAQHSAAQHSTAQEHAAQDGGAQDHAAQNSGAQDSGAQDSGPQDHAAQNSGAQDSGAQDSGPQDHAAQNSGAQDSGTQDSGNQGHAAQSNGAQDSVAQDNGPQDSGTQDHDAEDSGAQDSAAQDNDPQEHAAQDSGAQDHAAQSNGTQHNGAQHNGAQHNGAQHNGAQHHGARQNGVRGNGQVAGTTLIVEQRVLALSAMGRSIMINAVENYKAATRVMLISGHRSLARPITAISPAVFAQVNADTEADIALASIEDVNPDGAFSAKRETVLGIEVETDHRNRHAAETRALHDALTHCRSNIILDVAERAIDSAYDVEVALRFQPDADGAASAQTAALAQAIRDRLDQSEFQFRVLMRGCLPGSATDALAIPVVELTTQNASDVRVIQSVIDAAVATSRAAADLSDRRGPVTSLA